jgi:ribosomal protein S18 acetylase RimI-like enzyme
MSGIRIRRAAAGDAEFLAWVTLAASRGHVSRGLWDVIIGADERGCLDYLRRLAIAEPRSLYHCESFLIAEVDGAPAAGLCTFDPHEAWTVAGDAMTNVQRDLGWTEADAAEMYQRVGPIWASCMPPDIGADLVIENVATRPEYRGRGLVGALIEEALECARDRGAKLAQITTYIGNDPALSVYEKSCFRVLDEKRCSEVERVLGVPGFVRLTRELPSY